VDRARVAVAIDDAHAGGLFACQQKESFPDTHVEGEVFLFKPITSPPMTFRA